MSSIVAGAIAMSPHRIVNPTELGAPSGFSHAVVAAGTAVYLAGQIGSGETIAEQFDSAAGNLVVALRAAGGDVSDLVSLQIFVTDVAAYKAVATGDRAGLARALRPPLPGDGPVRHRRAVRAGRAGGADGGGGPVVLTAPLPGVTPFPPVRSSRRRLTALALVSVLAAAVAVVAVLSTSRGTSAGEERAAAISPATNADGASAAGALSLTVGGPTGRTIPSGFLGLSIEYPAIPDYAGRDPKAINPVFVQLVRNLTAGQAPELRIGGDTSDWTWWPVPGVQKPLGVRYSLSRDWVQVMAALTKTLGARVILGINLELNSSTDASARGPDARERDRPQLDRRTRARQRARAVRELLVLPAPGRHAM